MSKDVENKVVSIEFDNSKFEKPAEETISTLDKLKAALKFKGVEQGFNAMSKAIKTVSFNPLEAGILKVMPKFTFFERFTIQMYDRLANKIIDTGKLIATQTFTAPISTGKSEYEEKMGAIQTIMASTGESLETVNRYLNELNKYSDDTIYSFSDMTNSIGKFTNAGIKLEDAVEAIKGISNEAALSGANANEASRAMYNFAQALSSGSVKLIDWKSIENANMATEGFKQQLIDAAVAAKTLTKTTNGYITAEGKALTATQGFNDSLQDAWLTSEVLITTLKKYGNASDDDVGAKATAAATEVKTLTMMLDTLKEALQSGWAETWENIIGNFEEAKDLWTSASNALGGIIDKMGRARNTLLKSWKDLGGRRALIDSFINIWKAMVSIIGAIRDGFRTVFPPMTADRLVDLTNRFKKFTRLLIPTDNALINLRKFFTGVFDAVGIVTDAFKALYKVLMPIIKDMLKFFGAELSKDTGRLGGFVSRIRQAIKEGQIFEKVFGKVGVVISALWTILKKAHETLFNIIGAFADGGWSAGFTAIKEGFKDLVNTIWDTMKKFNPVKAIRDLGVKIAETIRQWPIGKAILDTLKKIKDAIVTSPVWQFCVRVVNGFVDAIQAAINRFSHIDTKPTEEFTDNVKEGFKPLEAIKNFFVAIWHGIQKIWEVIGPTIKAVGKAIGTAFSNLYDGIKGVVNRSDMGDVGVFNAGTGLGLMMTSIAKFMLDLNSTVKNAGATIKGLQVIITGITDLVKALKIKAYASAIKDVAISLALLAGAVFVLSSVPADRMYKAVAAVELLFAALSKTIKELTSMNLVGGKAKAGILMTFGVQLALVAAAIGVLTVTMIALALVPYEAILKGLAVILLLMRALTTEATKIANTNGNAKAVGVIVAFTIFIQALLIPLAVLSLVAAFNASGLWVAAGVISALLIVMGIIVSGLAALSKKAGTNTIKVGGPLFGLVAAIIAISLSLSVLMGVIGIITAMGGEGGAGRSVIDDAVLIIKGLFDGLIKFAAIFVLLPMIINKFSKVSTLTGYNKKGQFKTSTVMFNAGNGSTSGGFGVVVAALFGMAFGVMAIAAAMLVMAAARKMLDQSEWEDVSNVVLIISGILGATAILIAIINTFKNKIQNMFNGNKIKANLSLFPPLVSYIFAVSALLLSVSVATSLLEGVNGAGIVKAIILVGLAVGLLIALKKFVEAGNKMTKSLKNISIAFEHFAKGAMYLSIGVGVIIASIGLLAKVTGGDISKVAKNLNALAENMRKYKQDIVDSVSGIASMIVEALITAFASAWITSINEIFNTLLETLDAVILNAPKILDRIWTLISKILDSIYDRAPEITDKLVKALARVIDGLATALDKYSVQIIEAINKLIESIVKILAGLWARLWGVTKEGMDDFVNDVMGWGKVLLTTIIGIFTYKKLKKTVDDTIGLFAKLKSKWIELVEDIRSSRQLVTVITNVDGSVEHVVENVGTLKDYFVSWGKGFANVFKQIGKGIGTVASKIKGLITAHPVMTAIILIGLALKKVFDYLTDHMEVVGKYDKEASDIYKKIRDIENEYNEFINKRNENYKAAEKEYTTGQMYLEQLRECVDSEGKLKAGKEDEFRFLQKNIEPYMRIILDETTGRVTAEDEYGKQLDITSDKLDEIYKKQMLQKKIQAAMQSAEEARDKKSSMDEQVRSAEADLKNMRAAVQEMEVGGYHFEASIGSIADLYGESDDVLKEYMGKLGMSTSDSWLLSKFRKTVADVYEGLIMPRRDYLESLKEQRAQYEALSSNWDMLAKAAGGSVEDMENALKIYNSGVVLKKNGATAEQLMKQISEKIEKLKQNLFSDDFSEEAHKNYIEALKPLLADTSNFADDVMKTFLKEIGYSGNADAFFENLVSSVTEDATIEKEGVERIKRWAEWAGIQNIDGLISGLKKEKGKLFQEWKDLSGQAMQKYCDENGINSPSKVYEQFGIYEVLGLIQGITSKESTLEKAYSAMAASGVAAYTSAMSSNRSSMIFTPMINPSGIQNGTAAIQGQLNSLSNSPIGATLTSQLAASVDTSQISSDNAKIIESITALQEQVRLLGVDMTNLQVVMDTGATVGALAPAMDTELGRRTTRKLRGV